MWGGGGDGFFGHVVLCDLNSGTYHGTRMVRTTVPELHNSCTYQNFLSHVAILEGTRIVAICAIPIVPELSD